MAFRPVHARAPDACPPGAWTVCRVEHLADKLADGAWTLVEFWAPDNLFCRLLAPVRAGLRLSHAGDVQLICCTLDDSSGGGGAAFGAIAIPALILFHQGRRVQRWIGATDVSLLRRKIDSVLGREATCIVTI